MKMMDAAICGGTVRRSAHEEVMTRVYLRGLAGLYTAIFIICSKIYEANAGNIKFT